MPSTSSTILDTCVTPLTVYDSTTTSTPVVTLVSQCQEANPLETLIATTAQTENHDFMSPTVLQLNLDTYTDETFIDQVLPGQHN